MLNDRHFSLRRLCLKAAFVCALGVPAWGQVSGSFLPNTATQKIVSESAKPATTERADSVLGYRAWVITQSEDIDIKLWQELLARQDILLQQPENQTIFENFLKQLAPYQAASLEEKMVAIDSLVDNMITYKPDVDKNNTKVDVWSCPIEILKARTGDCDDFATLKYYALRHLGIPPEKVFLAVIEYPTRYHAIVVVDPGKAGRASPLVRKITPRTDSAEMAELQKKTKIFYALNDSDGKNGQLLSFDVWKAEALFAMNEKSVWQFSKPRNTMAGFAK